MRQLECHMIEPIRCLMYRDMNLDVVDQEFSAGYGIADLIGAALCRTSCQERKKLGIEKAFDRRLLVDVLMVLRVGKRISLTYILNKVAISESTLRQKIIPVLAKFGLITKDSNDYIRVLLQPPNPVKRIVAIEVKQTKWKEAILQARRYTFFANQTYVAVWNDIVRLVDKSMLYRHRLGLIGVEKNTAEILIEAPLRNPREVRMNRFCAEYLYGQVLNEDDLL